MFEKPATEGESPFAHTGTAREHSNNTAGPDLLPWNIDPYSPVISIGAINNRIAGASSS